MIRHRARLCIVGLALSIALAGCDWPQFRFGTSHTGQNPFETAIGVGNVSRLAPSWSAATGGGTEASPAVSGNMVYVHTVDDHLDAYDATATTNCSGEGAARTCTPLWRVAIAGTSASFTLGTKISSPAVANGMVYVGSAGGVVYGIDAATGAVRWTRSTGDAVRSSPTVTGGLVYVGSDDTHVYALDAATGQPRWTATTGGRVMSSPAVANGLVYAGSDDGRLWAYDAATGAVEWSAITSSFVQSSPAVVGGVVYVGSGVSTGPGRLDAFDAAGRTNCSSGAPRACSPLWSTQTDGRVDTSPAVANGVVYVGIGWNGTRFANPTFEAFDATTGRLLWTSGPMVSTVSSPAVANGVVYIGSDNGTLYAFDASGSVDCAGTAPKTCTALWSAGGGVGLEFAGSPAVVNGTVYWGSEHRPLTVYRLP